MGAASYVNGMRYTRPTKLREYEEWINKIEASPSELSEVLGLPNVNKQHNFTAPDVLEFIMLSLRRADGINMQVLRRCYGQEVSDKVTSALSPYLLQNLVKKTIVNPSGLDQMYEVYSLTVPAGFLLSNKYL